MHKYVFFALLSVLALDASASSDGLWERIEQAIPAHERANLSPLEIAEFRHMAQVMVQDGTGLDLTSGAASYASLWERFKAKLADLRSSFKKTWSKWRGSLSKEEQKGADIAVAQAAQAIQAPAEGEPLAANPEPISEQTKAVAQAQVMDVWSKAKKAGLEVGWYLKLLAFGVIDFTVLTTVVGVITAAIAAGVLAISAPGGAAAAPGIVGGVGVVVSGAGRAGAAYPWLIRGEARKWCGQEVNQNKSPRLFSKLCGHVAD